MSKSPWSTHVEEADDPLTNWSGRPILSVAPASDARYVGRVVVEVWDVPGMSPASSIVFSADGDRSSSRTLLRKVARLLSERLGVSD